MKWRDLTPDEKAMRVMAVIDEVVYFAIDAFFMLGVAMVIAFVIVTIKGAK